MGVTISKFLWYFTALECMVGTGEMEWGLESRWQVWQPHFPASKEQTRCVSTGIAMPQSVRTHSLYAYDITFSHFVIRKFCVHDSKTWGFWKWCGGCHTKAMPEPHQKQPLYDFRKMYCLPLVKQRLLTHRHTSDAKITELHFWSVEYIIFFYSN